MLPGSTSQRKARDATRGRLDGRTVEIQRLIGRVLRAIVDRDGLGERTVWVDCDVIEADGGTRCAPSAAATWRCTARSRGLVTAGKLAELPLTDTVAAVSVGVVDGAPVLDLPYVEDVRAETDMNVVMTGDGRFVEVQGTAEGAPFGRATSTGCSRWPSRASARSARCSCAPARCRDLPRLAERPQGARAGASARLRRRAAAGVRRPGRGRRRRSPPTPASRRRGRRVHPPARRWWPTTPASWSRRSAARPASTPRATAATAWTTRAASRTCWRELGDAADRRAAFVCVLVAIAPDGSSWSPRGAWRARSRRRRAARAGSGTTRSSSRRRDPHDRRDVRRREGCALAPGTGGGRAARRAAPVNDDARRRAAALATATSAVLIAVKVALALVTGSVAALAEATHAAAELLRTIVAAFAAPRRGPAGRHARAAGALEGGDRRRGRRRGGVRVAAQPRRRRSTCHWPASPASSPARSLAPARRRARLARWPPRRARRRSPPTRAACARARRRPCSRPARWRSWRSSTSRSPTPSAAC